MIPELDRYQGVVLRQLLVSHGGMVQIGVTNVTGRVDAFSLNNAAFQIKHSSKRLSPWQFTYLPENLSELEALAANHPQVWVFLVCGIDGVVGLAFPELRSLMDSTVSAAASIRVSRSRNAMYRVSGPLGGLPRAKPRGVDAFLAALLETSHPTQTYDHL